MPKSLTSAPSLRAMAIKGEAVGIDDFAGRAVLPGATSSSPVPSTATLGRRCTFKVG